MARGKVRDIYDLGDRLLLVATDRLSAFDVVMPTPIPDKGRVLTQLSLFWFDLLKDVIPNHVLSATQFPAPFDRFRDELAGRSMVVTKTTPLPSNAWRAAISPAPVGRNIRRPVLFAAFRYPPACASPTNSRRSSSPRRPRLPRATMKIFPSLAPPRCWERIWPKRSATPR